MITGLVSLFILAMIGGGWTFDVSEDLDLWGGYAQDKFYQLNIDVFIIDNALLGIGQDWALVPARSVKLPIGRTYYAPSSIAAYRRHGGVPAEERAEVFGVDLTPEVVGVAEKGTMLQVRKITQREWWNLWGGHSVQLHVYAEILSGPFVGETVDLIDVSVAHRDERDDLFKYGPVELIFDPRYF